MKQLDVPRNDFFSFLVWPGECDQRRHISRLSRRDAHIPKSFLQFVDLCLEPCNILLLLLNNRRVTNLSASKGVRTLADVRAYITDVVDSL